MARLGFLPARKATQAYQIFVKLRSMEELSVITITFEVYKKLLELNPTLERQYRYGIGNETINSCADILEQLILAKHAPKPLKVTYITQANAYADLTALKLRAILELKLANNTTVLQIQAKLTEARKMIGGWKKSC